MSRARRLDPTRRFIRGVSNAEQNATQQRRALLIHQIGFNYILNLICVADIVFDMKSDSNYLSAVPVLVSNAAILHVAELDRLPRQPHMPRETTFKGWARSLRVVDLNCSAPRVISVI